ncbi:putative S-adenosyl-L-methionine-dependent methyltransferase, Methyltransferase domain 25 [Helianthus debilis subsp. tardiflorus]
MQSKFNMAQEYFKPAEGGILVDVSCGSGLFSRKFAKSRTYSKVIALDFSENMLRQTYDFMKADDTILNSNLALVRADVSRLPFPYIAEINRVLRSGGVIVGTTFLRSTSSTPAILRPFDRRIAGNYNYLIEEEIEDLVKSCGFTNYTCKVQQAFIMFSAQKP